MTVTDLYLVPNSTHPRLRSGERNLVASAPLSLFLTQNNVVVVKINNHEHGDQNAGR